MQPVPDIFIICSMRNLSAHAKRHQTSATARSEAMRIARGTQRPGQTKEQTKLIAQGIQKGIEQYRTQQNAKAREQDRKRRKSSQQVTASKAPMSNVHEKITYRQHWLPWVLLIITWLAIAAYWFTAL
jgi:sensor domain CHASE-containing protein